jgi:hypothetical protein
MNVPISSLVLALAWPTNHQVALKVVVVCSAQMFAIKAQPGAAMERLQWFWRGNRHCSPQGKTDGCWTRGDTTGIDTIAESGICTAGTGCCQASARRIAMANS